ncbi:hypothetical protein ACO0M4_32370 [Streptomyces sp. RGM 3693]|uniref:hypothetical protein n=1 Tax=Streptomyces sp. RGM 3693 TaxID=3413284 RepID=UPI003D29560E
MRRTGFAANALAAAVHNLKAAEAAGLGQPSFYALAQVAADNLVGRQYQRDSSYKVKHVEGRRITNPALPHAGHLSGFRRRGDGLPKGGGALIASALKSH